MSSIPVFCINLDRRPERWAIFSNQPALKGITLQRISAVDGNQLNILSPDIPASDETRLRILRGTRRSHGEICTKGAIGCTMSHVKVWDTFLKTEHPFCIVLEDDCAVPDNFLQQVIQTPLPPDAHVWLLAPKVLEPAEPIDTTWLKSKSFWGTAAYLLTRSGATLLKQNIYPIEHHIDRHMHVQQALGRLHIVMHKTLQTGVVGIGTDIQTGSCDLCNLPDNLSDSDCLLIKKDYLVAVAAVVFFYFLYTQFRRNDTL